MKALIAIPDRTSRPSVIEKTMLQLVRAEADGSASGHLQRAAAPVGTTASQTALAQNQVGEFIATLAPLSAAAQLIAQGISVPMASVTSMKLPAREGGPSTTVAWVAEATPIEVRSYVLNDDCELSPKKWGFIVGITRELAKRANGEAVIRQLMREDAAAALDASMFNNAAASTDAHAGMLNGVTPKTGYAGGDREAINYDLSALSNIVSAAGSGQVAFIVSPARAARIRIVAPDLNRELTFLPSLAVADTTIIAIDPQSWAYGFGDDFEVTASEYAALHMSDDPLPIVSGATADPVRSYFQTAAIGIRLLADVAFAPRRPNSVAWATNVQW